MKLVRENTPKKQLMMNCAKNILLLTFPMLYIIFTFTVSFTKNNSLMAGVVTFGAFVFYLIVYSYTFKYLSKEHYVEKLGLQVLLANLGLQTMIFIIGINNTTGNKFGSNGLLMASCIWIILVALIAVLHTKHYRKQQRNPFGDENLYELIVEIISATIIIFLFCQVYILWATLYIWLPLATLLALVLSIYKNGVIYQRSDFPINLSVIIPLILATGILSIFHQFSYEILFMDVWGVPFWGILITFAIVIPGFIIEHKGKHLKKTFLKLKRSRT